MHNKRSAVAVLMLSLLLALAGLPSSAYAQAPAGNFVSGIACVNLDGVAGTASLTFYNADGTVKDTATNNNFLSPWQIFTPNQSGLGSGFQGSGVVSSDKKVACGLNSQTANGSAVTRVGTSSGLGADDIDTTVYATQITRALGGFDTYVAIQNADSTSTDVTATYFDKTGAQVFTQKRTLPGFGSTVWYQAATDANLPAAFIGSAKFSSTGGKLAGVVALYNAGTDNSNAQFLSFNTVPAKAAASKVFLPRLAKNLSGKGYTSGWACQNVGPGAVDVKMTVNILNQDTNAIVTAELTKTGLGESTAWSGYLGGTTGAAALDAVAKGTGSAIVEVTSGTGKIACTANEDNRTVFAGQGITYNGIPDGKQTGKIFFAQIVALGASSFRGGFQIANTTATATTCSYVYANAKTGNTITVANQALAANGSNSVFAESSLTSEQANFNGSAVVTCGQPIVGIYNLSIQGTAAKGDPFAANAGINQ